MDSLKLQRVAVIGSDSRAAALAAHLLNVGFRVALISDAADTASSLISQAKMNRPSAFYLPDRAHEITCESMRSAAEALGQADWVVLGEGTGQNWFSLVDECAKPHAVITTTSSLQTVTELANQLRPSRRPWFLCSRFFHPVRSSVHMEVAAGPETNPMLTEGFVRFCESTVAKRVILAKDVPGHIALRFALAVVAAGISTAEKLHMSIEDVDTVIGSLLGSTRGGPFTLADQVGLDLLVQLAQVTKSFEISPTLQGLVDKGWTGVSKGRGFYRYEGKDLLTLELTTMAYRDLNPSKIGSVQRLAPNRSSERVGESLRLRDEAGEIMRTFLPQVLSAAKEIAPEVSQSIHEFDQSVQWGLGWEIGPFELLDVLGQSSPLYYWMGEQRSFDGRYISIPRSPDFRRLTDFPVIEEGATYRVRALSSEQNVVSITTEHGMISPELIADLLELMRRPTMDHFVLASEATDFSAGFELDLIGRALVGGNHAIISSWLMGLQALGEVLETKHCVAAIHGRCLGTGLELAISCPVVVAHADTIIGLPQARGGVIAAGRGTTLMRLRNSHSIQRLADLAVVLATGTIAPNADQARATGYLRSTDLTCYHADRLLTMAHQSLKDARPIVRPEWKSGEGPLAGMIDRAFAAAKAKGALQENDRPVAEHIKGIFAKATSYQEALDRERSAYNELSQRSIVPARLHALLDHLKVNAVES